MSRQIYNVLIASKSWKFLILCLNEPGNMQHLRVCLPLIEENIFCKKKMFIYVYVNIQILAQKLRWWKGFPGNSLIFILDPQMISVAFKFMYYTYAFAYTTAESTYTCIIFWVIALIRVDRLQTLLLLPAASSSLFVLSDSLLPPPPSSFPLLMLIILSVLPPSPGIAPRLSPLS